jgi:hypothetical protein
MLSDGRATFGMVAVLPITKRCEKGAISPKPSHAVRPHDSVGPHRLYFVSTVLPFQGIYKHFSKT